MKLLKNADDVNETEVAAGEVSSDEPPLKEETSGESGVPKFAPYLSYDNYLIDNQIALASSLEIGRNVTRQTAENKKQPLRQDSAVDLADNTSATDRPLVEVKIEPNLDLVEDQNFDPNEKPQFVSCLLAGILACRCRLF